MNGGSPAQTAATGKGLQKFGDYLEDLISDQVKLLKLFLLVYVVGGTSVLMPIRIQGKIKTEVKNMDKNWIIYINVKFGKVVQPGR